MSRTSAKTPLATRIAGNRFLASKPSALRWTDGTQSTRTRVKSFAWFLSGGWRSEGIRFVLRLVLTALGARSTMKVTGPDAPSAAHPAGEITRGDRPAA